MGNDRENSTMTRRIIEIGLRLFVICAISAVSLGIVSTLTRPQIEANRLQIEKDTISRIVDSGTIGDKTDVEHGSVVSSYPVYRDETKKTTTGYVLKLNGTGYGGTIVMLAFYKSSGEFVAARLLENKETPGLGKKAEDPAYMNKFVGKGGFDAAPIPVTKAMLESQVPSNKGQDAGTGNADSISSIDRSPLAYVMRWMFGRESGAITDSVTGATITFVGVSGAIKQGSDYVKSLDSAPKASDEPAAATSEPEPAVVAPAVIAPDPTPEPPVSEPPVTDENGGTTE